MQSIKHAYAHTMQGLGAKLYASGILCPDSVSAQSDLGRWLHSLFAIYDIDAMIRLDLPWWTLRSVKLVDRFLSSRAQARVFEYGTGASTAFLARRSGRVTSIEHDPRWYSLAASKLSGYRNVDLHLVEAHPPTTSTGCFSGHPAWGGIDFRRYVDAIDDHAGAFDLIIIDGRCRDHCLNTAKHHVKPDGMILFDNATRSRYRGALESCDLARLSTKGLTACLPYSDPTVLLAPKVETLTALVAS